MARIRTIKPSFWEDEKIARLPRACRLFYIGMWNQADDMGVIRGNPALLKSAIFPYDEDLRVSEVQKWIDALVNARMLIPITYKSESYYIIRTFRSHQKFDARYPNFIIPEEISSKEIDNYEHPMGTQRVHTESPPREREGEMEIIRPSQMATSSFSNEEPKKTVPPVSRDLIKHPPETFLIKYSIGFFTQCQRLFQNKDGHPQADVRLCFPKENL